MNGIERTPARCLLHSISLEDFGFFPSLCISYCLATSHATSEDDRPTLLPRLLCTALQFLLPELPQGYCHRLGMRINCQCRAAAATAPSSGAASLTICVSFMTPVSATALVAIPLLSPLVTGHSILAIGMSSMPLLVFDHHYSPLPCFGSEVEPPLMFVLSHFAIVPVWQLPTCPVLLLDDGYCI